MVTFFELTGLVQEAKASRKFGVLRSFRYEPNRNRLFYKTVTGIFKIPNYQKVIAILLLSARLKPKRLAKKTLKR